MLDLTFPGYPLEEQVTLCGEVELIDGLNEKKGEQGGQPPGFGHNGIKRAKQGDGHQCGQDGHLDDLVSHIDGSVAVTHRSTSPISTQALASTTREPG